MTLQCQRQALQLAGQLLTSFELWMGGAVIVLAVLILFQMRYIRKLERMLGFHYWYF